MAKIGFGFLAKRYGSNTANFRDWDRQKMYGSRLKRLDGWINIPSGLKPYVGLRLLILCILVDN